ncbi:MAG TPA: zf-HC2 domain-containing protein [Puia sp.]|nr:zf-HC2 domain-containing protein [Puia sp.]
MRCELEQEKLSSWINNEMSSEESTAFEDHLNHCEYCNRELVAMKNAWSAIAKIEPEPGDNMWLRFDTMLNTYKQSLREHQRSLMEEKIERLKRLVMPHPWFRIAFACALVVAGFAAGFLLHRTLSGGENGETVKIEALSSQMQEMKEMFMLSLLENPSASERIRGVSYSAEIPAAGKKVVDALLSTLNNDPNVNVRLVALDALTQLASVPGVREGLVGSILHQDSPLMQVSLADVMLKLQEKRSIQPMKDLLQQKNLNLQVRTKIEQTLQHLI